MAIEGAVVATVVAGAARAVKLFSHSTAPTEQVNIQVQPLTGDVQFHPDRNSVRVRVTIAFKY